MAQPLQNPNSIDTAVQSVNFLDSTGFDHWFYISLLEFGVILWLLLKKRKGSNDHRIDADKKAVSDAKKTEINMDNVINSIHLSEKLYKELSRKYHPDRFIGDERHGRAEELFQEISKNKRNYSELLRIREIASTELNN